MSGLRFVGDDAGAGLASTIALLDGGGVGEPLDPLREMGSRPGEAILGGVAAGDRRSYAAPRSSLDKVRSLSMARECRDV